MQPSLLDGLALVAEFLNHVEDHGNGGGGGIGERLNLGTGCAGAKYGAVATAPRCWAPLAPLPPPAIEHTLP